MAINNEAYLNDCRKDIEKDSSKKDTVHLIENYISLGMFFICAATAALAVTYSLPVTIGAASAASLAILYNIKSTKEFKISEKKKDKLLKKYDQAEKIEPLGEASLKMLIVDYIKKGDLFHQVNRDYENYQMTSLLTTGFVLGGMALSLVSAPVALALDVIGVVGTFELAKKEFRAYKKKEALELKLKTMEYQINISKENLAGANEEEEKCFGVTREEFNKMYEENKGFDVTYDSYNDKPKVYIKEKEDK